MDSASSTEPQTRIHQQEVVADLGQRALEIDDLDQLMHDATAAVTETLDTDYCHVLELLPDVEEFVLRNGVGWDDGVVGNAIVPTDEASQAGYTLLSQEPVIVDGLSTDGRFSGNDLLVDHDVTSGITVIIGSVEDPWGVLGTFTTGQRTFTEHDANFVQSVANVLASAIENEQAQSELEEIYGRISDAFFALDEEWRFTHLNDRAHELINPDDQELTGENVWEQFPAATERKFKSKYEHAMYEQETVSFEEYYPEPLDAWFEVRAYPSETGLSVYFRDITERKEREAELAETIQELQDSEERLRLALEAGEMGTWELDLQTEDSPVRSPQHDRIFGYDEPLDGWDFETFLEHVHPDDREMVEQRFEEAFETGRWEFECRITRVDGEQRVISAKGEFYFDSDREPVRAVGVVQDVTERKRRERQLAESEQRYRTLAECFPNGIVTLFDNNMRYTLAAGRAFNDLPVSQEDVEDHYPREVWGDEVADTLEPALNAALDGEERSVEVEYADRVWIIHVVPVSDDEGEVFAGMTMAQDITERKTYQAELERTLDLLEKTERIADVGGWEIEPDTLEVFWTNHIFELLEVSSDEEPPLDEALAMYHKEDKPIVEDAVEEALDSGDPFDIEARIHTDSGNMRWLRLQGAPETVDGDVVSLRGAAQDITERKEREQQLEELVERLEESNERLEQFAYAASHDLQEPLRMVSSYLQLIERRYGDAFDEDGEEYLEFAVDGAERMRNMIDGLLEYSRVETQGNPFEPVDLDAVFEDVLQDLQMKITESNAEITAEELPRVYGDDNQLNQVFQNLLSNAIEYSGDEPPRVHVSVERCEAQSASGRSGTAMKYDDDQWVLSVSDEGIGIDPADADRIFEVFESLHAGNQSGTGIGLALCERIIERHGGEIWVEPDPGEGTTFSFTLPAVQE